MYIYIHQCTRGTAQTSHPGDVSQPSATVTTGSKGGVVAKADAATLSKSFAAWGGTGIRAHFVWAVACAAMSHAGGGGGGGGIGGDVSKGSESCSEGAGTQGAEGVDTGELAPEARMHVMALHRSGKSAAQIRCLCLCVCACVCVCVCACA
jgi:hypothetical protein